jgi:hypothetical protein
MAKLFYAHVRKTDNMVVHVAELDPARVSNPPSSPVTILEITQAQYDLGLLGLRHEGSSTLYKYQWVDPDFVPVLDTRPVVTFTPDVLELEVGDTPQQGARVTVTHSGNITQEAKLMLTGVPMLVDFVGGSATIDIYTDKPYQTDVPSQETFVVASPLQITVRTRILGWLQ